MLGVSIINFGRKKIYTWTDVEFKIVVRKSAYECEWVATIDFGSKKKFCPWKDVQIGSSLCKYMLMHSWVTWVATNNFGSKNLPLSNMKKETYRRKERKREKTTNGSTHSNKNIFSRVWKMERFPRKNDFLVLYVNIFHGFLFSKWKHFLESLENRSKPKELELFSIVLHEVETHFTAGNVTIAHNSDRNHGNWSIQFLFLQEMKPLWNVCGIYTA